MLGKRIISTFNSSIPISSCDLYNRPTPAGHRSGERVLRRYVCPLWGYNNSIKVLISSCPLPKMHILPTSKTYSPHINIPKYLTHSSIIHKFSLLLESNELKMSKISFSKSSNSDMGETLVMTHLEKKIKSFSSGSVKLGKQVS